jgi:hypothetical protein
MRPSGSHPACTQSTEAAVKPPDTHKRWPDPCQPELDGGRQRGQDVLAKPLSARARRQAAERPRCVRQTLVSQSWTAGGREAKIYRRRQQPARQHASAQKQLASPRSGTSPRSNTEHAGTALEANIPLRTPQCSDLEEDGTYLQLANNPQALVRTESGPLHSGTSCTADGEAASVTGGRTCRYSA